MPDPLRIHDGAGDSLPAPSVSAPHVEAAGLTASQYLVLISIMVGAAVGDALLSRGMREIGPVTVRHSLVLLHALVNPYVAGGILVLIGFMASYMTALSWADLTFVQPATAFGNVVTAAIGRLWLHESITPVRWLGIALIVLGVGFVANGPTKTEHAPGALPRETSS